MLVVSDRWFKHTRMTNGQETTAIRFNQLAVSTLVILLGVCLVVMYVWT